MTSDHMIRASDRDRDAVAETLREACAAGRLTLPEFTERMEQAFTSKTWGELRALTRDLPEQPRLGADLPDAGLVPHPDPGPLQPPAESPAGSPVRSQGRSTDQGRPRNVPRQRSRGWGTPVPFVLAWLLIVLVSRSASVAVPVVVLALVLLFTALSRRS